MGRKISTYAFCTFFLVLAACTDYVAEIDSQIEDLKEQQAGVTVGSMTDSRDAHTYKTLTIGSQVWMAENLNYKMDNSYCYDDVADNCTKYGRLYTWTAAMAACPSGWHLPSKGEWEKLFSAVGEHSTVGTRVFKSASGWYDDGNGKDILGFSALPAGSRNSSGTYSNQGYSAYFWSSTEDDSDIAYDVNLYYSYTDILLGNNDKDGGLSVRCLKGEGNVLELSSSSEELESSSSLETESSSSEVVFASPCKTDQKDTCVYGGLMDSRDSRIYKTVSIGLQIWMAENLNFETDDSYCYDNSDEYCAKYGRLYTWTAAKTACPEGWHLPSKAEWETLLTAVGDSLPAGKMLKSQSGWNENGNGADSFSFSVLPAGYRSSDGRFDYDGNSAYFWSASEYDNSYAYRMALSYSDDFAKLHNNLMRYGLSVRCLKD